MFFRFFEYLERQAQRAQGKGFGAKSLKSEVRAALAFLPRSGAIVFDVGSNKGLWAREMLAVAGPRIGKLYCFEPSRFNHEAVEAIGDPRVVLIKEALSDKPGRQNLHFDAEERNYAVARINSLGRPHRIERHREIEENLLIANFVAWRKDVFG